MTISSDYLKLLQSLLPAGKAWNRSEDSWLGQFLYALSEEFARVDQRSSELLTERDTRYSNELLIDHEKDLGLPDECSPEALILSERRLGAHSKLITLGQQTPAYFIELAAAYGWVITVTEYKPAWSGIAVSGDPCGEQNNLFYWKITIGYNGNNIIYFTSGSSECGDYLAYITTVDEMICRFNKLKPAHTTLLWDYDGPEFGTAFSSAFDSIITSEVNYLEGAFGQGFGLDFDVNFGGDFGFTEFDISFRKPN
jgi:uncharacterized protein YmfQ (DUF2313 family)